MRGWWGRRGEEGCWEGGERWGGAHALQLLLLGSGRGKGEGEGEGKGDGEEEGEGQLGGEVDYVTWPWHRHRGPVSSG